MDKKMYESTSRYRHRYSNGRSQFWFREKRLHRKGKIIRTDSAYLETTGPLACCFSKERDNILMWSHYANHHKGVCLSFRAKHRTMTKGFKHATEYGLTVDSSDIPLYHMRYKKEKPKIIDLQKAIRENDAESFLDYLLTKSPCWNYEKEYRLISIDKNNIKKFTKDELEGVIFGLRIKYNDACKVYKTVEKNYINKGIPVKFYKATEDENKYAVNIEEVEDIHEYLGDLSSNLRHIDKYYYFP